MIAQRLLERVEADPDSARAALGEAARHLESASEISARDPNGAYQLAYDGARKAVMGRLRLQGLRVRRGEGGHAVTAQYAGIAVGSELGTSLAAMRRRRNRSEYGTTYFGAEEVQESIAIAAEIIAACEVD